MATFVSNTIIKYDRTTVGNYNVADYTSKNFNDVSDYINSLDSSFFDFYQMRDDDKIERVSLELYGTPDYWDILLIVNNRNPLFDMPFNFDTLSNFAEDKVQDYIDNVYKQDLSDQAKQIMQDTYTTNNFKVNEELRILKIIRPTRIYEFLQGAYERNIL